MSEYRVRFEGSGLGINNYGVLRVINEEIFICDSNLLDMIRHYDGKWAEVAFFMSDEIPAVPMDPLIEPLVQALNGRGIVTLGSCEGHLNDTEKKTFPYVSYFTTSLVFPLHPKWIVEEIGTHVSQLRTIKSASTPEELKALQESIGEQTAALAC